MNMIVVGKCSDCGLLYGPERINTKCSIGDGYSGCNGTIKEEKLTAW